MMNENDNLKIAASVAEVARMVGLSRERFYQLQREGVFPMPIYNLETRRPYYTDEMQQECMEVRRRNCGVNGKPVLFYSKVLKARPISTKKMSIASPRSEVKKVFSTQWLVDGVEGLGAETTAVQVDAVVKTL